MEAVVTLFGEEEWRKMRPTVKARILANDIEALIARAEATRGEPGMEEVLSAITMPCLVYVGKGDEAFFPGAEEWVSQIPNATFVSLPDLNHFGAFHRSDLVLPHVFRFLKTVNRDLNSLPP